jgi:hypothetical protein
MMHLVLKIDIDGDVDQSGLERLRTELDLKKQGRLTDDWDEIFGKRTIQRSGGESMKVALYRHSEDGSWTVNVSATEPDLRDDDLTELRAELVGGIAAAGYRATVRAKPTYGPKP